MIAALANSLWAAGCIPEYSRFCRAAHRVAEEQHAVLHRTLRENADTEFGRRHGFTSINSVAEFQERVPIRDYEQLLPWIRRAADGVPNVLTREAVQLFEPTSGSSGTTKLIPYTHALQREFQRGINAWMGDLFLHHPKLLGGPAYWSISPASAGTKRTSGGIPIGFDDDTAYLGGWRSRLVQAVMAVPGSVRTASNQDDFNYLTILHLLRARDLRLISVWSPTFLLLMLDRLASCSDRILHDFDHGIHCAADPRRAREVREALSAATPQETYARLWPNLHMISCWKDASSAGPAAMLATLFPHSIVQGKGLIATEAFMSLPLIGREDAALSVRSHFFEFLPSDADRPLLGHQLEPGGLYSLVVTTGGGLYRYKLGDQIEVTGYIHGCPLLRFVGRDGSVSDWFGEKLNDAHVSRVFEQVFAKLKAKPIFAMLACDIAAPAGYVLYIESDECDDLLARSAEAIDTGLRENFHYDYARRIGQLACVRAVRVRNGVKAFSDNAICNGQKLGDVKVPALNRRNGWSRVFDTRPEVIHKSS